MQTVIPPSKFAKVLIIRTIFKEIWSQHAEGWFRDGIHAQPDAFWLEHMAVRNEIIWWMHMHSQSLIN